MKKLNILHALLVVLAIILTAVTSLAAVTTNYEYDDQYRLTKGMRSDGTTTEYRYDEAGNRTRKIVSMSTGSPVISASPSTLDFGTVPAFTSATKTLTISNSGTASLLVNGMALLDNIYDSTYIFSINPGDGTGGTCGSIAPTVAPGTSCTIAVTASPGMQCAGPQYAALRISSNDAANPVKDVPLSAYGTYAGACMQTWIVTPSAGANGSINPSIPLTYYNRSTATFTVTPASGYQIASVTGCGGTLSGNSYTTGAITSNCAVTASFSSLAGDTIPPTITSFSIPAISSSLTVPITAFTATDNVAVTGYCVTEVNNSGGCNWSATAQTSYVFSNITEGVATPKSLYAWAKDAVGNVSASVRAEVMIAVASSPNVVTSIPSTGGTCRGNCWSVGGWQSTSTNADWLSKTFAGSQDFVYTVASNAPGEPRSATIQVSCNNGTNTKSWTLLVVQEGTIARSAPAITSFTLPAIFDSLKVPITSFTAVDNVGVTGYMITESSSPPSEGAVGWSSSPLTQYTFISAGTKTLYAWAKDATGNVSAYLQASVTINLPLNGACGSSNGDTFTIAPVTNLCSPGIASSVTGTGPWDWSCSGTSGATTATCSANIQTFTIPITVPGGNGTVSCTSPVNYDGTSTCTITPATGYQLATLTDNGADKKSVVSGNCYIIYNVTATHNISVTLTIQVVINFTPPSPVPQTGQTTCYGSPGTVISCSGTGQDAELKMGVAWPNPRFVDNGDQTVTDKLTGLIWSKDANPAATTKPWQDALDYVKKLNTDSYLGHNDWRLPNYNELESLVNKGQPNSATWLNGQGFTNVQTNSHYWSSSTLANTYNAWDVYMNFGSVNISSKAIDSYIWPVRGGQSESFGPLTLSKTGQTTCYDASGATIACSGTGQDGELQIGAAWPNPRFVDNGDQSVTDNLSGLVWSKDGNAPGPGTCGSGTYKTWQGALDYVKCLNSNSYLGKSDWRLPNRNELASMVNKGQANSATWLNGQGFLNVQANCYWSSSPYANYTDVASFVFMDVGNMGFGDRHNFSYVWPVRAGQSGLFGSLNISKFGTGSGNVTSSPAGISCGATCSASSTTGTSVTLTPMPDNGSTFAGWSGDCSGTGPCTVTMDAAKSVSATFNLAAINGACGPSNGGTFTVAPTINFCSPTATVTLNTTATGWSWRCGGTNGGVDAICTASLPVSSTCGPHHWTDLPGGTSPSIMHLAGNLTINGRAANSCDEIAAYDSIGNAIGYFYIQNNGQYGDMVVNGDSSATTTVDEGATAGEKLTLRVWDGATQKEYSSPQVLQLTPQQGQGGYVNYQGPLTFTANNFILADVAVETGIQATLKTGWNMLGWTTKQVFYEGTTAPQASDLISGGTMSSMGNKMISDVFGTMGFTTSDTFVAVGPDGVVYTPGSPFNTLKKLLPGKGYWVYVPSDKTLTIPGTSLAATDEMPLNQGWTQIGYWGTDAATPAIGFGCINGLYDVVVDEAGKVFVTGSPFNTLKNLQKNKGYFIHTTAPATLKYQCP